LNPQVLVPSRGEAVRGEDVMRVLIRHRDYFQLLIENKGELPEKWSKPTDTCMWWTPEPNWEF